MNTTYFRAYGFFAKGISNHSHIRTARGWVKYDRPLISGPPHNAPYIRLRNQNLVYGLNLRVVGDQVTNLLNTSCN